MQNYIKIFLLTFWFIPAVFAGTDAVFSNLNLDQATKKVLETFDSTVLGAKTESIDGKVIHIIKILTEDGRVQHLKIDAKSGNIIQ